MTSLSQDSDIVIIRQGTATAGNLPSVQVLWSEAAKAQMSVAVVAGSKSPEAIRVRSKRRHDLKAGLRTIQLLVKALQGGYRFDDDQATAKIEAVSRASLVLEKEFQTLDHILLME